MSSPGGARDIHQADWHGLYAPRPDREGTGIGSRSPTARPLTLGTAGHIDHGKTALVHALTGKQTDRLPEERRRGISIALGFAPLTLPSGRQVSVIDVPGHERYVRTMVAGATGIDFFLMTVAADDGVMPQTREHAAVLRGLGIAQGVIAVTKADLMDPATALDEIAELLPGIPAVAVSARTGLGIPRLRTALDGAAAGLSSRAEDRGPPVLHVDRVFTVRGAGTVVTGTLWRGSIGPRDELLLEPGGRPARVRSVQVHDQPTDRAGAGQRVAVNLVGFDRVEVERGAVLTGRDSALRPTYRLDVTLENDVASGTRVHVHHGTREAPARVTALGERFYQLRLERSLIAEANDRLLIRQIAPPDTLGGGLVLDARPRKHGPSREVVARLAALECGERPEAVVSPSPVPAPAETHAIRLSPEVLELERRLKEAGHEPPGNHDLDPQALADLRATGRAVRAGRALHFHTDVIAEMELRVRALIEAEGAVTLARLRDELGTSRKFAQALLEHFDGERITIRRPDDSRVLRRRPQG